jgi:uncharacterized protein (TIGR04255 family)
MVQKYKRPPITEAVVEVRIAPPANRDLLDKVQGRLQSEYPLPPQRTFNMHVEVGEETAKLRQEPLGYRLTSTDASEVVSIAAGAIATSRLPPYEGWEPFVARARKNWETWKRVVGRREIIRIGVRYVNRIDVPNPTQEPVAIEDYLNFSIRLPPAGIPPVLHFAINAQAPLGKDECKLILNASTAPSPLVKTVSFILDLDVSLDVGLPQNDEALWALVDRMREYKNFIFETCITDRARALFS